jgi:hypothetical protein
MATLQSIHKELVRDHVAHRANEEELLLWMTLIHTHRIYLAVPLQDAPDVTVLEPATQRTAASVIAEVWSNRQDKEKTSYIYWYRKYQQECRYETMSAVPAEKVAKIDKLCQAMESDSRVRKLIPS